MITIIKIKVIFNPKILLVYSMLIILTQFNHCFANNNNMCVTLLSNHQGITFKQICVEVKKQTGIITLIASINNKSKIDYRNLTIEIDLININVYDAYRKIEDYIRSKYDPKFVIKKDGECFVAGPDYSEKPIPTTRYIRLKYISYKKMTEIIREKLNNVKIATDTSDNGIIYFIENDKEIKKLLEKYDVELTASSKETLLHSNK